MAAWPSASAIGREDTTMHPRLRATIMCAAVLMVCTGCERKEQDQDKAEVQPPGTAAAVCDNSTMLGNVSLTITGNPGDSFRIAFLCDGQQVVECTATIAAGQNTAQCSAGPAPVPNGGARTCPVGPGNNNSPAAAVQTSGCG